MEIPDKQAHEVALARFAVIAPVINGSFTESSATAYYRRIAQHPFVMPDNTQKHYSPRTYEDWVRKYKNTGIEGLMPRTRSDAGGTRRLSEEAKSALLVLKNRFPKMNATMMYERIIEDGVIVAGEVSLSSVQRFCARTFSGDGALTPPKDRRAFESARVGGIWQADSLYGPYVDDPRGRAYIQTIIDDKSRTIVACVAYASDNAANFQATLRAAIARFGIPEKLYVDNGSAYRNDQLSLICGQLGIVLIHAPVRDGAAKGKIERANRTLRTRFISILEPKDKKTLTSLNDALSAWVSRYNATIHSSIGARPIDIFSAEAHLIRKPSSQEWLCESFLNRVMKKVGNDARIRIKGVDFDCPCALIGSKVEVRYDPADLSHISIIDSDHTHTCYPTDLCANANTKRKKPAFSIDYSKTNTTE